jgi:hypothetical protein
VWRLHPFTISHSACGWRSQAWCTATVNTIHTLSLQQHHEGLQHEFITLWYMFTLAPALRAQQVVAGWEAQISWYIWYIYTLPMDASGVPIINHPGGCRINHTINHIRGVQNQSPTALKRCNTSLAPSLSGRSWNMEMSIVERPLCSSSAAASPIPLVNLKPWPLHADTISTCTGDLSLYTGLKIDYTCHRELRLEALSRQAGINERSWTGGEVGATSLSPSSTRTATLALHCCDAFMAIMLVDCAATGLGHSTGRGIADKQETGETISIPIV